MTEWTEPIKIRPARADDAKEIARIYNQGVQDRAATFENAYVTPEERYLWLVARPDKYPVLVAAVKHTMLGWASLTPYSPRACYSGIAELSIYIDRSLRGHGVLHGFHQLLPHAVPAQAAVDIDRKLGDAAVTGARAVRRKRGPAEHGVLDGGHQHRVLVRTRYQPQVALLRRDVGVLKGRRAVLHALVVNPGDLL